MVNTILCSDSGSYGRVKEFIICFGKSIGDRGVLLLCSDVILGHLIDYIRVDTMTRLISVHVDSALF